MNRKIKRTATFSNYQGGRHIYEWTGKNDYPSISESLNLFGQMFLELAKNEVPLGSTIKITMEVDDDQNKR